MAEDYADGEAEDGSFADLRGEFDALIQQFTQRAAADREKRADGVAVAARTDAEPGSTTFEPALEVVSKQEPFNPQPVVLVPHFQQGEKRPIPQRRELATGGELDFENDWQPNHPLRSESIAVRSAADGQETEVITAGTEYSVECTVRNVGGLAARNVNVELYVEHLEPDAVLDVNDDGVFEASWVYEGHNQWSWLFYLSGVTTMAPTSPLFAQFHDQGEAPPAKSSFHTVPIDAGNDQDWYDRSFFETSPTATDYVPEDEFTVDVWDVSRIGGEISPAALEELGVHLTRQEGQVVVDGPERYWSRNHDLTGEVSLEEGNGDGRPNRRIEKTSVSIPQNDSRTVTFEYTPDERNFPRADLPNAEGLPAGAGRPVTALYVRAYSLATNEVPRAWGEIDHTASRFMGRTEVKRRL